MKSRLNLTPAQLLLVSLSGVVISAASLSLTRFVRTSDACGCIRWTPFLFVFGLCIPGILIAFSAIGSLRKGIQNQRWSEEQIEPLRSWLESSYTTALLIVFALSYLIGWALLARFRTGGFVALVLGQLLSQLRWAVRRPPAPRSGLIANWRDQLAPIHSEHWGRR
ncbi:MAG TPA: hypothetical protein VGU25_09360 [Acidobacteriaceae bacterium]|nr:hypothetical protein [Acidobacteriaceae bacterium]